jgi:hypothetical protein
MSTQLKHLFIFLLAGFLFTSCEKELSEENGGIQTGVVGGTAVYNLDGSPGTCIVATVNGDYKVGTAMNISNTITLSVNVTTIGTYTISTNALNGISFSGAGAFVATGQQTITLTGSGTAIAAGTFTYAFGANGCSFSVTVNGSNIVTDSFYYDINVNGVQYKKVADSISGYGFITDYVGSDSVVLISGISFYNIPQPPGSTELIVKKGLLYNYPSSTFTDFKNFFLPGNYSYSTSGSENGISIEWKDPQGKVWKSDNAPRTQTGSSFNIISSEEFNFNGNFMLVKVYAEFDCTLYDDAGNSIVVTNGKFKSAFEKY